jgi:DNA-binding MarR family transcriptional regulator
MPADRLLVLHGLRLKGFAEAAGVAALFGLDDDDVTIVLKELSEEGFVLHRDGRVSGWSLTTDGRAVEAALVADELHRAKARGEIERAFEQFLDINGELLGVCTAWQLKSVDGAQVINDHADVTYDAATIHRLSEVHAAALPTVRDLGAALPRFGRYEARLEHALAKVEAGKTEWFTKPLLDSYHSVWFELHEDLLSTLGLQRGAQTR